MSKAPVIRRRGSRDLTANHKRLYGLVRRASQISRADLTRQSGLTFPSVSRLANDLLELGLLKEGASRRGGMGKPPIDLSVNPDHGFSLGIYLNSDEAKGNFIDVLGETLKETSFPAASLAESTENALAESGLDLERLIGICLATTGESLAQDERRRLSTKWGVPVFAVSAIAASVQAERYFGSASELGRFVYVDATSLELGVVVDGTVLAQPGTLSSLLGVQQGKRSAKTNVLPTVLKGAAALIQGEALVVGGLSAEDLESLRESMGDLSVVPASAQASDPALAAASVPLDETFGA